MADFMFLFREGNYQALSPEEMQKIVQRYMDWVRRLREAGKFKGGDELRPTGRMLSVQNGKIVDGPFTESKEMVGGYFVIEAADYDEAVTIAKESPGLAYGGAVEVRLISDYT